MFTDGSGSWRYKLCLTYFDLSTKRSDWPFATWMAKTVRYKEEEILVLCFLQMTV